MQLCEGVMVLPNEGKKPQPKDSLDVLKNTKMKGEEFSHEERMTNEVASTEYMGGGKKRGFVERRPTGIWWILNIRLPIAWMICNRLF